MNIGSPRGVDGATLLSRRFVLVVSAGLLYFLALSMLLPVLPRYVENELGGGSIAVGITSGSLFVGAILLRPYAGRIGDRVGRRVLIIGGGAIVAPPRCTASCMRSAG
jgi:MFS family permease